MDYAQKALGLHAELHGKLEIKSRVSLKDKEDLALAYTPGVAQPCLEIQKDAGKSYELTRRWNTVAVVTDGTAVLGLGDIGPEAGMPVMEGKCALFKEFADVDAFPICAVCDHGHQVLPPGQLKYLHGVLRDLQTGHRHPGSVCQGQLFLVLDRSPGHHLDLALPLIMLFQCRLFFQCHND